MRIVLDLQGAQSSGSRNRGIGRYSLALAQGIARNRGQHEVFIALNGQFPETVEPIRAAFEGLLPQENIRVWESIGSVSHLDPASDYRREAAEYVREAFLAELNPDIVHISSLFEGLGDDSVTSLKRFAPNISTSITLYDLIPHIYRTLYLDNPALERWYDEKLGFLKKADLLLAISASSRQESIDHLGFDTASVVNVSTAAEDHFQPLKLDERAEVDIRSRYRLSRPFVMYTGGIDHRKNIEGLIRSFAKLPQPLRTAYQLAIVCSVQPESRLALENLARQEGLGPDELILTGFVPDEDLIALYNLCHLFVFPSWHEGFGLPALEAMRCGAAVIGANTSSLPEVIGRPDAMFDPRSDEAIAAKLLEVLTDDDLRADLARHGLEQAKKFSWDESAKRAIAAFEDLHARKKPAHPVAVQTTSRPKLAFVSPLPPEHTGIADYSAELLPALARHYEITVVANQEHISDPWIQAHCEIRDSEWLRSNAGQVERVLYHFGNSAFHQHMFDLLEQVPGTVVLHDFFLSGIQAHREIHGSAPNAWVNELYQSHGYGAVAEGVRALEDTIWRYPANLSVLQQAQGVIVHSGNSLRLAQQWYEEGFAESWAVIPLLRVPAPSMDRAAIRVKLGIDEDDFLVCSFGMLGPIKLNHRLIEAWLNSLLAQDPRAVLVFVGENHGGEYGSQLLKTIRSSGLKNRIRITGWTDANVFREYLSAADAAVQLRTMSRGETSAAVLDSMNHGLPTIVNANGSMADLPKDCVWMLPDEFEDAQLAEALETLWRNPALRSDIGARAKHIILTQHAPKACAQQYFEAIEKFHKNSQTGPQGLLKALSSLQTFRPTKTELMEVAQSVARNHPVKVPARQLFVDISELVQRDGKSGIQRVVRNILKELLENPPAGYRIEPVYAKTDCSYRYARRFTLKFLACPENVSADEPIDFQPGDIFLGLDLHSQIVVAQQDFYQLCRRHGVIVKFVVFDLLPIQMPDFFPDGSSEWHRRWLEAITQTDGAVCISKAVANELATWLKKHGPERLRPFEISWFHLGADIENASPSLGLPADANRVLNILRNQSSFLMVGTVEPRKGYEQTLAAFEELWKQGVQVNLIIVGKQGWLVDALAARFRQHPELGHRLFWLEAVSDEYLKKIYAASTCLIAASTGEGFGLPLIEAAQHRLPIIARDIPVFREVAGEYAYYFQGTQASDLAQAIRGWLDLYESRNHPQSDDFPWLTWKQSTQQLLHGIFG